MIRHSPPPLWTVGRSSQNFEVCPSLGVNVRRFLAVARIKEESVPTNPKYRRHAASLSFSQRRKKTNGGCLIARQQIGFSHRCFCQLAGTDVKWLVHLQASVR